MTGPEHFDAAEQLLAGVEGYGGDFTPEGLTAQIAIAQVHATLALAAPVTAERRAGESAARRP